jgi:hypothetical protein
MMRDRKVTDASASVRARLLNLSRSRHVELLH